MRRGGVGGTSLVVGVRWPFRGKDAGSPCSGQLQGRLRTRPRGGQRGPTAQTGFRQALLTQKLAARADEQPAATELDNVLAPDHAWTGVADVLVERPARVGELPATVPSL